MILDDIIKKELELKYKVNFDDFKKIKESIKNKYFINNELYFLFLEKTEDNTIASKCLKRSKFIEKREFSYISDLDLYKKIEKAYNLFYILLDYNNLCVLWNKEFTKNYDKDYIFLKKIVDIYLKETENLVKDIEEYELGGSHENKKNTNENLCSYKRKVRKT